MLFYENYVRLCNSVNKSPSAVALEIGISKPTVSRWKSGSDPNTATILKVADYFGVAKEELTESKKENPTKQTLGEVIPNYSDLSTDNQKKVRDFIDALLTVQQTQ